jgi:Protein of unknown function (DUF2924)
MQRRREKVRRETGGLFRSENLGTRRASEVEARLKALEALSTAELQTRWRQLYRHQPPTRLSRDLLLRGVAFRVQEGAYGGLSRSTERRLRTLWAEADQRGTAAAVPAVSLRPGTELVREWRGQMHTVAVLDDGFEHQGERYNSLTSIAFRITGAHRSGPLFFGIRKKRGTGE